ncbi:hypothetical protein AVEN_80521-1 [Araneus ventricosus]|uniref:Uncharacterized protein n=1 Tax=Araneus ventricosus TaxID=182803 RepID=A0A4Y2QSE2_ARAVE|nr:hypothetical protein AVEN_164976-1 [Araneus ventricosus]GBN66098.1 hypothetical protein AVEN_80521-1 [Araneus ventricosus]
MNYFSVIRPSAGQTTQPQSCASLHGVDCKRSTPNWKSLSVTRVWATQPIPRFTPRTPLDLRKAGPHIYKPYPDRTEAGNQPIPLATRGSDVVFSSLTYRTAIITKRESSYFSPFSHT